MSTPKATPRDRQELEQLLSIQPTWKKKVEDLEVSKLPKLEQDRIRQGGEAVDKRIKELQALGAKSPPG